MKNKEGNTGVEKPNIYNLFEDQFDRIMRENAALLAALKELIPIAERALPGKAVTTVVNYDNDKSAIENAKLLTDGK